MKWSGSAASSVDLNPTGFDASEALCTSGTQQGGWGYIAADMNSHQHALLWSGDAASAVDLQPAGYVDTRINAMSATQQVGDGWVGAAGVIGSVRHALVWSGSADTVVDLNQYLPAGYTNAVATGIDADGNVVGYAYNSSVSGLSIPPNALAVVFAPGAAPASGLSGLTVAPSNLEPGAPVQVTATLSAPAPMGGITISFLSDSIALLATPASVVIAEGESTVTFAATTAGAGLTIPTNMKLFATDGSVSRAAALTLTPVVKLAGLTVNPVEGGFATYGSVTLNIPAQIGGATISLTSGNTSLLTLPTSVTIPQGYTAMNFSANTAPVATLTAVQVAANLNGFQGTSTATLSPAPVVSVSGLSFPSVVGGNTVVGTITLNNFPRGAAGATITLTSGDSRTVQVPATVTVPQGAFSVTFVATTTEVSGLKNVSVKAEYNGSLGTANVPVYPIPTVTITQADYVSDLKLFKVAATTSFTNAVLTFGTDPNSPPVGTMQFEQGTWKGSTLMDTAPTIATVWNSQGGLASMAVTVKTSSAGGGGGGGSVATGSYKLAIATTGKGSVTTSPSGSTFAAGTVVTLTATPAAGSPWVGWTGDVVTSSKTISITMNKDMKVTANFK